MSLLRRALVAATAMITTAVGLAVPAQAAAAPFKVLAFYNGTWDAAHIDFDKEAIQWFPQAGAQNGFTWEATTDWSRLSATGLSGYQVIMFLDDSPPAERRAAFQTYMQNGGAWMGFHVSAFTTDANSWSWYYNSFLGSGNFATNTWGPTAETLKIEDRTHPTTAGLPATIQSSVSEWYSWSKRPAAEPEHRHPGVDRPEQLPGRHRPQPAVAQRFLPADLDQQELQDDLHELRPQRDELRHQHPDVVDLRQRPAEPVADQQHPLAGRRVRHHPAAHRAADRPGRLVPGGQQEQRQMPGRPRRRHRQRHRYPAVRLQRQQRPAVPVSPPPAPATSGSTSAATRSRPST